MEQMPGTSESDVSCSERSRSASASLLPFGPREPSMSYKSLPAGFPPLLSV